MKIPEKFYDIDGNEVSLYRLCRLEPGWAANQIRLLYGKFKCDQCGIQLLKTCPECENKTMGLTSRNPS